MNKFRTVCIKQSATNTVSQVDVAPKISSVMSISFRSAVLKSFVQSNDVQKVLKLWLIILILSYTLKIWPVMTLNCYKGGKRKIHPVA